MKASPLSISSYQPAPHQRLPASHAPRFGGVGDAVSSLVGVIDSNRMMELMASDGIGMILPRTALALKCRGSDDGRETFLREVSGLIGNIFLVGWAGYAVTRLLGDTVNPYNPKGIPGRAWIAAPNLDAFGKIYQDELKKKAPEAGEAPKDFILRLRQGFVERILSSLESDDHKMSIEGRLASLEQLSPKDQAAVLEQMKAAVPQPQRVDIPKALELLQKSASLNGKLKDPAQRAIHTKLRQELKQQFLNAGWGKLSDTAKTKLTQAFALKDITEKYSTPKGTIPLDKWAQQRLAAKQAAFQKAHRLEHVNDSELAEVLKQNGFDSKKEFIKERLSLSLADLGGDTKKFHEELDKEALLHGLTSNVDLRSTVHINGTAEEIKLSSNRGILLKELKHFLEQFADRAANEAAQALPDNAHWGDIQKKIDNNLFDTAHKADGGNDLLRKFMPHESDGLITAAIKAKGAYTWIPMAICFASAGAFTFYNNYLTMKKHSGKVFFPGEGMPPIEGTAKSAIQPGHQAAPGGMGIYKNFGNFPNYPQFRNSQGGIIA